VRDRRGRRSFYAELIVVVHLDAGLGKEGLHGFEVVVRNAGAAVEQQYLDLAAADPLGPDLVFAADNGQHADASGADAGRIERFAGGGERFGEWVRGGGWIERPGCRNGESGEGGGAENNCGAGAFVEVPRVKVFPA
jgi:hypothetical protein